jgi:hypothetical protein
MSLGFQRKPHCRCTWNPSIKLAPIIRIVHSIKSACPFPPCISRGSPQSLELFCLALWLRAAYMHGCGHRFLVERLFAREQTSKMHRHSKKYKICIVNHSLTTAGTRSRKSLDTFIIRFRVHCMILIQPVFFSN